MKNTWNRLGSALAVTVLLGALTACSSDDNPDNPTPPTAAPGTAVDGTTEVTDGPEAEPTEMPTDVPIIEPDANGKFDYCKNQAPFTGPASDEFGAEAVADAYCTMVTLQMEQSFLEDHLRNNGDVLKPIDFSIWTRYMTAETAEEFNANVEKALKGNEDAFIDVLSLTFFDMLGTDSGYAFTDEPAVLNRTFSPASTDVEEFEGNKRLILTFDVFGDVNVVKEDTNEPHIIPVARRIGFALVRNPVPTSEENDWLIESWTGNFTIDQPIPRPDDYIKATKPKSAKG